MGLFSGGGFGKLADAMTLGGWSGAKGLLDDFTGKSGIDAQNRLSWEMWNAQNEYNTPANQVARYRAAGLNPNLIYGSGSASAGNAGSVPQLQAYQGSFDKVLGLLGTAIGLKGQLENQQLDKVKTFAGIAHQQDVLKFDMQRAMIEDAFKDTELKLREKELGLRTSWKDREYTLAKDKWDYERKHIDTFGAKPGTWYDFLGRSLGNVAGVDNGAMGISKYSGDVLNYAAGQAMSPIPMFGSLWNMAKSLIRMQRGASKIRY